MNYLDYLLLGILAISVAGGFMGGFARVGIGFIATVCGIVFGFWFYGVPSAFLRRHLSSHTAADLIGFFTVFLLFVLAGSLLGWLLAKLFKKIGLTWLDRLLGAAFGLVRGAILLAAFVTVIMAFTPKPPPRTLVESRVVRYFVGVSEAMAAVAPRELSDSFHEAVRQIRKIWSEHVQAHKNRDSLKVQEY